MHSKVHCQEFTLKSLLREFYLYKMYKKILINVQNYDYQYIYNYDITK